MALAKITQLSGRAVTVPGDDVDTDRIIPARFMKCVTFDGLGEFAFFDVRFDGEGKPTAHPLNDTRFAGASIFLVGRNFGCGSSREHAPQSLAKFGVRAIIGMSFAEIFYGNCTTLGLPCVSVSPEVHAELQALIAANPSTELSVDVAKLQVRAGAKSFPCEMPSSAREALIQGIWDPIALLLDKPEQIHERAKTLDYAGV